MTATTAGPKSAAGFELYDLRVEVVGPPGRAIYCGARLGGYFEFCPDSHCPTRFRISRTGRRRFRRSDTTAVALPKDG